VKRQTDTSNPETRLHPGLAALVEVGIMFLPGIPAFFWLWPALSHAEGPNVRETPWITWVQVVVYFYLLAGCLLIGLRRWSLAQLGLNRNGLGLSLLCGLAIFAGRTLVVLAVRWPRGPEPLTLPRVAGDILFYFGLVGLIEELIFRGLVYRALDEWRGARWAIWGSTVGFVLFHVGWRSPLQGLGAFIIGLIFAVIRWRAGGIVGLILTHGLIDVGALWMLPELRLEELGRPEITYPGYLLLGCALILVVPLYLWHLHPRVEQMR
jgi:membrane protease YdiL (CAAX protease family)